MSPDKKKVQTIFNRIDKLAAKGKDNIYEYHKLVDELVEKGDYNYLELTLHYAFGLDINDYKTVQDVKNKTWNEILFQTNTPVSKRIKKVFDVKGLYQMGFGVYSDSISSLSVTYSTSYTATYSISGSQSILLKRTGDNFYLTTTDTSIYKIDISKAEWGTYSNVYQPIPYKISPLQSIPIKKPYGWTFSGSTQSSNISVVIPGYLGLYSTNKPSFKEGDTVKITTPTTKYNGLSKIKNIAYSNSYWYMTIDKFYNGNCSSGTASNYPLITDNIKTEIPINCGGEYLIRTYSNSSIYNYRVFITRNSYLGEIKEVEQLSEDSKYYLQNKQYARLIGTRTTYLEVTKSGESNTILINTEINGTEETNLVNRYKIAIDYLIS